MKVGGALAWLLCGVVAASAGEVAGEGDATAPGTALFNQYCSFCHDHPSERVPTREALRTRSAEQVVRALSTGIMRAQAANLSALDIRTLAVFLTGREPATNVVLPPETNACARDGAALALAGPQWNGWGRDTDNSRYQPEPGLASADVPRLAVKWALGYRGKSTYGQPVIVGGRLYVTSEAGRVYSLDAGTGCSYWTYDAASSVRTAIVIGSEPGASPSLRAYFGDDTAIVYAVDAASGNLIWQTKLDSHPMARITGSPTLYGGRLYVPVASLEEVAAADPAYECCKFRGSVVALAADTGRMLWRSYVMPNSPRPYRRNARGTQLYGPAGGSVWSAPTIDPQQRVLYVGTGNSYTDVPVATTDAILALDLDTGKPRWSNQLTPHDNFIVGCLPVKTMCPAGMTCAAAGEGNCPRRLGDDGDFGSSLILRRLATGRRILIASQKSGLVYGLDPDRAGKKLWETRVGAGGSLGGVEWGVAADTSRVYVPISDLVTLHNTPPGGLQALRFDTGDRLWRQVAIPAVCSWGADRCSAAQSQAVSVIPGAVFSGSEDGHLRAYSADNGAVIWDVNTAVSFATVNGIPAAGGSLDGGGPVIANGMLFVNSGYGRILGRTGNVLLAFSVGGK
jgi:polyvinyl alcohol dehydrogenase (cytochrome)